MKFKKLLALLLCIAMVMSFAACGGGNEAPPADGGGDVVEEQGSVVEDAALAYFANFPADKNVIKPEDLFAKMDAGEDMFILDVRAPEDYAKGHLKGAVNMPFGNESLAKNLELIPNDVPVYVTCYTGQTASQTTSVLNIAGKPVKNIQSGWNLGISAVPGFEAYVDTEEVALPTDSYPVDAELKAAVANFFSTLASYAGTPTASQNVTAEYVKEIVDAEADGYFILDVRQAEDFAAGHIKGATNIPFGTGMEAGFADLPTDQKIIVTCYSGQTASQVVGVLRMLGLEAYNLQHGMSKADSGKGWLGSGYETVTE